MTNYIIHMQETVIMKPTFFMGVFLLLNKNAAMTITREYMYRIMSSSTAWAT